YAVWIATVSSQPGSGALPAGSLESRALAAGPAQAHTGVDARALAAAFRALPVPVIGRVHGDAFILDLRGLEDEEAFIAQLRLLNLEAPA
ncbi:MAG: L-seryl-tRNA(Sec) selenium transferase, partial [Candidimonas sp.]